MSFESEVERAFRRAKDTLSQVIFGPERMPDSGGPGVVMKMRSDPRHVVQVRPPFRLVFLSVLGLTVACGIAALAMAIKLPTMNANQQSMFEGVNMLWKVGAGAIFGLLGGKAV